MTIIVDHEYQDDLRIFQIQEVHADVVTDARTIVVDTKAPPWADEWPPSAPPGVVMRLAVPIRCGTCNRVHEYMTQGCTPVLFGDNEQHGDMGLPDSDGFCRAEPPEGLHVVVIPARVRSDQDHFMYAVVRKGADWPEPFAPEDRPTRDERAGAAPEEP